MKHPIAAMATAALLALSVSPGVLAAEGADDPAPSATLAVDPAASSDPIPTPVENGEIVIDPTFFAASPEPQGGVAAETGRPQVTPPATDTYPPAARPGSGLHVLLVLAVAGSLLALAVVPHARRRS